MVLKTLFHVEFLPFCFDNLLMSGIFEHFPYKTRGISSIEYAFGSGIKTRSLKKDRLAVSEVLRGDKPIAIKRCEAFTVEAI